MTDAVLSYGVSFLSVLSVSLFGSANWQDGLSQVGTPIRGRIWACSRYHTTTNITRAMSPFMIWSPFLILSVLGHDTLFSSLPPPHSYERFRISPLVLSITSSSGLSLPAASIPRLTMEGSPAQQGTSITTVVTLLMSAVLKMSANLSM